MIARPDDADEADLEARERARYLSRRHGLRDKQALALAYRELGYSHSGIAKKVGRTEATVADWMEEIAEEFGARAIETKWKEQRRGDLR